jgi:hypothetical protein
LIGNSVGRYKLEEIQRGIVVEAAAVMVVVGGGEGAN